MLFDEIKLKSLNASFSNIKNIKISVNLNKINKEKIYNYV